MLTYPDVLERRDELTELMADLPVMLPMSENRSASFSSVAYVPSILWVFFFYKGQTGEGKSFIRH